MAKSKHPKPQDEIRRFDIFAEWNRLKGNKQLHLKAADARAYGLAVAKVVAGRSQKRTSTGDEGKTKPSKNDESKDKKKSEADDRWWEHLGSDAEFKKNIVKRMGEDFYKQVFAPAVLKAWDRGAKYEEIRDTLRNKWNKGNK